MTYFRGIRLFYVPKSYFFLMSELHVPIFDAVGKRRSFHLQILGRIYFRVTEIFEIYPREELTLLTTMNDCSFPMVKKKSIKMCNSLISCMFSQRLRSYYET